MIPAVAAFDRWNLRSSHMVLPESQHIPPGNTGDKIDSQLMAKHGQTMKPPDSETFETNGMPEITSFTNV